MEDPFSETELRRLVRSFLSAANRPGIRKIEPKIYDAYLGSGRGRDAVLEQLEHWANTNPSGRYRTARVPARALLDFLTSLGDMRTDPDSPVEKKSICDGVSRVLVAYFSRVDPRTGVPRPGFDPAGMIREVYARLEENWRDSPRLAKAKPSKENWRFRKMLKLSSHNQSPEKVLEKAIAALPSPDWVNQVPTASGLFDSTHDRHRNIDLVRRDGDRTFSLIELKCASDTPVYATKECLTYGMLYVLARSQYPEDLLRAHELLQADLVHLCVLAPRAYYTNFQCSRLATSLSEALAMVSAEREWPCRLDFQFLAFPPSFAWPCSMEELRESLAALERIR
jgi:hypothetical protein